MVPITVPPLPFPIWPSIIPIFSFLCVRYGSVQVYSTASLLCGLLTTVHTVHHTTLVEHCITVYHSAQCILQTLCITDKDGFQLTDVFNLLIYIH